MSNPNSPLNEYRSPTEVREQCANLFPSLPSLRWFIRSHRNALAEDGALLVIAERVLLHPQRFQDYVLRVGRIRAGATSIDVPANFPPRDVAPV